MSIKLDILVRPIALLALGLVTCVTLIGCSKSEPSNAPTASTPAVPAAPAPLDEVRIGYFANVTHAQAVLGVASGDFAAAVAPAKLTTHVFNAGPSLIESLLSNQLDIGYVGPGPALNAWAKTRGQGLRVIAGSAANGVIIVAAKDSGINTLADLKGRKLATPQTGNTQDTAAKHYLISVLGQTDTNNIVPIANSEQVAMMTRGQIDASWAPEPWGSFLIATANAKLIAEEKDLWPDKRFALTLVITTPDFLAAHADVLARILAIHRKWTQKLQSDPDSTLPQLGDALFALTNKRLPGGVLAASLRHTLFTEDPLVDSLKTMVGWSVDLGVTREPFPLDGLIDTSILKSLPTTQP